MDRDFALVSFDGVNSAAEAFAAERDRSGAAAPWMSEVGFVEHHENGHLVLRGTFAGHYVDVDEALHVSERGTGEGVTVGAVIGTLLGGPAGLAVGTVLGGTIGSQLGKPSETDAEPEPFAERLRAAVPRSGSAIVLIADATDVDQMIAAIGRDQRRGDSQGSHSGRGRCGASVAECVTRGVTWARRWKARRPSRHLSRGRISGHDYPGSA